MALARAARSLPQSRVAGSLTQRAAPLRGQLRMEEALKRTEHMNALLLRMAIADASDQGVALSVDPRRAEDATLLAEMEQLRLGKLELSQRASRAVKLVRARRRRPLPRADVLVAAAPQESLGTDAKRLEGEVESLREENETLRRRYQQMQRQARRARAIPAHSR